MTGSARPRWTGRILCWQAIAIAWSGLAFLAVTSASSATPPDRPPSPYPAIRAEPLAEAPVADAASVVEPRGDLLVVLGAEGTPEYGILFGEWAAAWEATARNGGLRLHLVGDLVGDANTATIKTALQAKLQELASNETEPLWIVMIGHGTHDGRIAKFNLVGEDVSADEFAAWLAPLTRPLAVLQCASSSGPFLASLSAPHRIVMTATRSGQQANFARFGGYLAAAVNDPAADLDKDQQVSLLEAFLWAARRTQEFYEGDNRLATEHPLLDDNGDGRGTRANAFAGIRPVRQADSGATLDGYTAHQWIVIPNAAEAELSPEQRVRRDELERAVLQLRERKATLPVDDYYAELERLLVELSRVSLGRTD